MTKKNATVAGAPTALLISICACVQTAGCLSHAVDDCSQNPKLACFSSGVGSTTSGGDGGTPPGCIPAADNKTIADDCGVFVSSTVGDDNSGDGSQAKPLKTLAAAVEQAGATGKPVYACAEQHTGSVTLASRIAIYGGLDCADAWTYVGTTKKSVLVGDADEVALTIRKNAEDATVADFTIKAKDATKEGGSSVAMLADGATAELVRCELIAGIGAKGADGAPGEPNGTAAAGGAPGNAGKDACSDLDGTPGPDPTLPGGMKIINDCSGDVSVGGGGGDSDVLVGGGGEVGQTGRAGQAGAGEPAMGMWSCLVGSGKGNDGSSGEAGIFGAGAIGSGAISASGYMGTSGGAGTSGKAGQGGGGGGGAKGGMICSGNPGAGASGGSGGAGGCGGLPGQGGGPGGASIALVSLNASIKLTDCTLAAGQGGDGGAGGDAQGGGSGGVGGLGGNKVGTSKNGCAGGMGGEGGNGGPGGGGLGGPSLGIAFQGEPPTTPEGTVVTPGMPGAGGLGGSGNVGVNAGEAGVAAEQLNFP
jgi:hypothetical protein